MNTRECTPKKLIIFLAMHRIQETDGTRDPDRRIGNYEDTKNVNRCRSIARDYWTRIRSYHKYYGLQPDAEYYANSINIM